MTQAPALQVDWDSGEGRLHLGDRLAQAPARFKYDVLADWMAEIRHLLRLLEVDLFPNKHVESTRAQCADNRRRRVVCEQLQGAAIRLAEPLVNGDVLLHLSNGAAVLIRGQQGDVKLDVIDDAARARRRAANADTLDRYVREDLP